MKAVMSPVPPEILEWRRQTGADRFDEMWDGILHMVPAPSFAHQKLEASLLTYLRTRWAPRASAEVLAQINVTLPGGWPKDFRIPDIVLLTPERFHINRNEYFEGAPDAVIEIRSPEDETNEKLLFYARVGIPEVWVIDRDTKVPEIHRLGARGYVKLEADAEGWLRSDGTGVLMKARGENELAVRMDGDESTRAVLPD